jgi:hypothetical protein
MEISQIDAVLDQAEAEVSQGRPPGPVGFWKAVSAVKANPHLIDGYADRIGIIDRRAFENWALYTVPLWVGNVVMILGTIVGLALVGWAYRLQETPAGLVFLLGVGVLMVTTHGLAHLIVGAAQGMRFTDWFIGSIRRPQPGLKVDYATYLRTKAASRAWMHGSGVIVTKLVPLGLLGAAFAADLPVWSIVVLIVVGLFAILTDVLWSTKFGEWKKFRREMRFAQDS